MYWLYSLFIFNIPMIQLNSYFFLSIIFSYLYRKKSKKDCIKFYLKFLLIGFLIYYFADCVSNFPTNISFGYLISTSTFEAYTHFIVNLCTSFPLLILLFAFRKIHLSSLKYKAQFDWFIIFIDFIFYHPFVRETQSFITKILNPLFYLIPKYTLRF